ncbi:hypothetical protein [Koleobacter methoxysyntrophicus]|uniref:hypothetical protein n=1 Tax=Koleobacter methoxysyntrophicus TaxID=2751313 RepID=UPI0019D53F17|nr:hypothetical protein [Koleobacter methoxysyntrophicus]
MYQSYPGWGGYPGQYMHMNLYYVLMGLRPIVNQVRRKFESGVPFELNSVQPTALTAA